MATFWKLLQESVIIQGTLTLALAGAVIYLSVVGQPVPDLLSSAFLLAIGFYFGSKSQQVINANK